MVTYSPIERRMHAYIALLWVVKTVFISTCKKEAMRRHGLTFKKQHTDKIQEIFRSIHCIRV
jgi:hypothetical protein